jgi:hypothetical protein
MSFFNKNSNKAKAMELFQSVKDKNLLGDKRGVIEDLTKILTLFPKDH